MTEKMKTVCVGRFLVDLPVHARVGLSHEMIDGFAIATVEESEPAFRARLAAREAAIQARGPATDGTGGIVEATDLRVDDMLGRIFMYGRNRGYLMEGERRVDDEFVSVEAHAHTGGVSFTLSMKVADAADARRAAGLLARLKLKGETEVPALPGFCIGRALFAEPLPPHNTEHVVMHIGLPDHPDLGMAFSSLPGGGGERSLLTRVADMDADAGPDEMLRVTRLRAGKRDIGDFPGEESLERVREFNFATTFGFMWESEGVKDNPLKPFLLLELHAGISPEPGGKPADASLHEDALIALWDAIASSIRLRPNGPPPPDPRADPPGPTLGTTANAGDVCPQSGWWQCREGGPGVDVHGGQVQYIRQGERMPQALLLPRQTLWQKVRRIQPSAESPRLTAWTLVDKRMRPRVVSVVALAQAGAPVVSGEMAGAESRNGPQAAVGSYVRTGETCPASGWWRCEETHALDGTRWFARGSVLPVATFQVPPGVFARADGPEVIQRRSLWQLVRQVEAPAVASALSPSQAQPARPADSGQSANEPPAPA
jgi:hypothetical protein